MRLPSITLIASVILLSISTSWASDREMMNQPRSAPPPETLPVPIPAPPRQQAPAPETMPIPIPEPTAMPERRPRPPEATPITLP